MVGARKPPFLSSRTRVSCQSVEPGLAFSSAMMPRFSAAAETPAVSVPPSAAVAEDFKKVRREISDSSGAGRSGLLFMGMALQGITPADGGTLEAWLRMVLPLQRKRGG